MPIRISRVLHAGYLLEAEGTRILFDPIFENPFSVNCFAFPSVEFDLEQIRTLKFDAVFISHFHDDHCSFESLDLLDRATPLYIYCLHEELFSLVRTLGFVMVHSLRLDQSIRVGAFDVTPRRSVDENVDSMFQIKSSNLNVLNVVDSWIDDETLKVLCAEGPWDLVLWPFQTLRETDVIAPSRALLTDSEIPEEWIRQLKALAPRYLVPSSCQFVHESWSWYNNALFPISYRLFESEVGAAIPETKIVRLNPSLSVELNEHSLLPVESLNWVKLIGDPEVDYEYVKALKAPSTSEIAKNFPPLSKEKSETVFEYCEYGIKERYQSLGPPADIYFNLPRVWKLVLYDHLGEATEFHYEVNGDELVPMSLSGGFSDRPVGWLTEISIAKFYSALYEGESLSSMYVRVNDMQFGPSVESEIKYADIVEDPLIRCLFSSHFGSYQIAQLKRLGRRAP